MNKKIIVLGILTIGILSFATGFRTASQELDKRDMATRQELGRKQWATAYNAGWRAGELDATSELIECEGVTDKRVIVYNQRTAEVLRSLGELDTAPYPCGE